MQECCRGYVYTGIVFHSECDLFLDFFFQFFEYIFFFSAETLFLLYFIANFLGFIYLFFLYFASYFFRLYLVLWLRVYNFFFFFTILFQPENFLWSCKEIRGRVNILHARANVHHPEGRKEEARLTIMSRRWQQVASVTASLRGRWSQLKFLRSLSPSFDIPIILLKFLRGGVFCLLFRGYFWYDLLNDI